MQALGSTLLGIRKGGLHLGEELACRIGFDLAEAVLQRWMESIFTIGIFLRFLTIILGLNLSLASLSREHRILSLY